MKEKDLEIKTVKDKYARQKRYYRKNRKAINRKTAQRINHLRKLGLQAEKQGFKLLDGELI